MTPLPPGRGGAGEGATPGRPGAGDGPPGFGSLRMASVSAVGEGIGAAGSGVSEGVRPGTRSRGMRWVCPSDPAGPGGGTAGEERSAPGNPGCACRSGFWSFGSDTRYPSLNVNSELDGQPNEHFGRRCTLRHDSRRRAARHVNNVPMTSFGDLLGPQPVLLPELSDAEEAILDGQDPVQVAAAHPTASIAWACLAEDALSRAEAEGADIDGASPVRPDVIAAYAFARTGYHRGLDLLRRNGWKGFGPVPWSHEPNRGFLRSVGALARAARAIGETDEYARCLDLLEDCDPRAASELGLD